jgi:DNA-binding Lrp family transcriptional regulator
VSAPLGELLDRVAREETVTGAELAPVLRILCSAVLDHADRVEKLERAVVALTYTPAPDEPEVTKPTTVYGVPVEIRPPWDFDDVADAAKRLPPGLGREEAVDELERLGVVKRVGS